MEEVIKDIKNSIHLNNLGGVCPEQHEAYIDGKHVGYLRLRHGSFTVSCPDVGGEIVYSDNPQGDGEFYDNERGFYLDRARTAIAEWVARNNYV